MTKSKKKLLQSSSQNEYINKHFSIFKTALLIGLLIVVFCTPYLRGLFFEAELLITEIVLLLIFILFWVYKWMINDKTFVKTPIEFAALGLLLVYILTTFTAVSQRLAISEFLKYVMFYIVFLMLSNLITSEKEKKYVLWTILASALGTCIVGIDSTAGGKVVGIFNSLFKVLRLNVNFFGLFVDGRIHSTMQYPNAFASYLMAVFFISISLTMTEKSWSKAFASAISFVLLTTFIFTMSRGAYILLVLAIPLFMLLIPKGSKSSGIYCILTIGIIAGGFSILLSKLINDTMTSKFYIWPLVIIGALISFFVRFTDGYVIKFLKNINIKVTIVSSVVLLISLILAFAFVFNASVPLELRHAIDEKDGYIGKNKILRVKNNNIYKLVFDVDAKSQNDEADFVYRIYIKTRNETGITSGEEVILTDERFNATQGIERKELEFSVPKTCEMVSISFQNYYSGTSAVFDNVKIFEDGNANSKKKIVLKRKYSFAESILSRFENLTGDESLNTRIIFVKDGLRIFKDWWFIGAGGGAWSLLNFKYQSYLYWSTQTHNYPLQVLVETGVIGIMFLMMLFLFIVSTYIKLFRENRFEKTEKNILNTALFTAIVFLFIHSLIDFDFSLAAIYLLVWQLIAVLNAEYRQCLMNGELSNKSNRHNLKPDNKKFINSLKNNFYKGLNVYPFVAIIISVLILVWPINFYRARNYAEDTLNSFKNNDLDSAIVFIEKAAELDYLNMKYITGYSPISSSPEIKLGYIDLLLRKIASDSKQTNQVMNNEDKLAAYIRKSQELAEKADKFAEYDADLSANLGIYYLNTTNKEKGIDFINKSLYLKPLVPSQWQYKANVLYVMAINYINQGDIKKGIEYINRTLEIIDEAKLVNSKNLSPFMFNEDTQKYLEKAYYIKEDIEDNQLDIENLLFHSVFEMDVNNDKLPDQWAMSDKSIVDTKLEKGIFSININDKSKNPYIATRYLNFVGGKTYIITVELNNSDGINAIPYIITGITEKAQQLTLKDNVFTSEFTISDISEKNNKLCIFIKDKYEIKSVKIVKVN